MPLRLYEFPEPQQRRLTWRQHRPSRIWVNSLQFKASGTNLRVTANIAGDAGVLAGANITMKTSNDKGGAWNFPGTSDTYGNATFAIQTAQTGFYSRYH